MLFVLRHDIDLPFIGTSHRKGSDSQLMKNETSPTYIGLQEGTLLNIPNHQVIRSSGVNVLG